MFDAPILAKSSKWVGICIAHHDHQDTTMETIHWARLATTQNAHIVTILIINHKEESPSQLALTKHIDII